MNKFVVICGILLFVLFSDVNAVNILNLKIQDEIIETYPAKDTTNNNKFIHKYTS
jgi:hypothetical protein